MREIDRGRAPVGRLFGEHMDLLVVVDIPGRARAIPQPRETRRERLIREGDFIEDGQPGLDEGRRAEAIRRGVLRDQVGHDGRDGLPRVGLGDKNEIQIPGVVDGRDFFESSSCHGAAGAGGA